MREIANDLRRWLSAGEQIALATVVWAEGPSPRRVGSRMAVTASGQMTGSISGGCVEGTVFQAAQAVLAGGQPQRLSYGTVDETGWEAGLACGGRIQVYVEPLAEAHRRLLGALKTEETIALATRLGGDGHLLAWPDGRLEGDRSMASELSTLFPGPAAELRGDLFLQVLAPPPALVVVGAVHLAQSLVSLAQTLGFRVRVVDARRVFAAPERFPTADELVVAWPHKALTPQQLRPQDAVVVLTHDRKFDLPALKAALHSPVGYIGLLGSQNTQAKRKAALREMGFDEAALARIHGPVGLDLGGREPAEIALAILAEIIAVQHGRSGGALSARPGRAAP